MEPRILYSADVSPLALAGFGGASHDPFDATGHPWPGEPPPWTRGAEPDGAVGIELVVLDARVPDLARLLEDLAAQAAQGRAMTVLQLSADDDALARIGEAMAHAPTIQAVHVLAHAQPGSLLLGDRVWDEAWLMDQAAEFQTWRSALSSEADLMFYGCDLGAGDAGAAWVQTLARLTGADVAASDDVTAAVSRGGDWWLEQRTGQVEAASVLSSAGQATWAGRLGLSAYDGFTVGGSDLQGGQGGSGWADAWTHDSGDNNDFALRGSSLADPSGTLATAGGQVQLGVDALLNLALLSGQADISRHLAAEQGTTGTTTWISFVVQPDGVSGGASLGLEVGDGLFAGYRNGQFVLATADRSTLVAVDGVGATSGEAALLVLKIEHGSGADTATLYVNPTPGTEAPDSSHQASLQVELGRYSRIALSGSNSTLAFNDASIDEVRVGADYISVAPNAHEAAPEISSPGAGASARVTVVEGQVGPFTRVVATDPNAEDHVRYAIVGGADAALFRIDAVSGELAFIAPPDALAPGDADQDNRYELIVSASDGLLSDTQALSVDVALTHRAPTWVNLPAELSVPEGQVLVTQLQAQDPNGDALTYTIVGGADADRFVLDAVTGELRFVQAPDHEQATDANADHTHVLVVRVSDGTLSSTQQIRVKVEDLNEAPAWQRPDAAGALMVDENSVFVAQVQATDPEGAALQYRIVGGADGDRFAIDATTGALRFVQAPDAEAPVDTDGDGRYEVVVAADDGHSTVQQALQVVVRDLNDEAPRFVAPGAGPGTVVRVDENVAAVTQVVAIDADGPGLSYRISGGADAGRFSIDAATGQLLFRAPPDAERPGDQDGDSQYHVQVEATDGSHASRLDLVVQVQDINDVAPRFLDVEDDGPTLLEVDEHTAHVTTLRVADADGPTLSHRIVGGIDARLFTLDAVTGELRFTEAPDAEAPQDANGDNRYVVQVEVSDGVHRDTQTLVIRVRGVDDAAPVIHSNGGGNQADVSVDENTLAVTTVVAHDVDSASVHYRIVGGADAERFVLDADSGALRFRVAPDAEQPASASGDNRYEVLVQASDGDRVDQQLLRVSVRGVDEAPQVVLNRLTVSDGQTTLWLQATDVDTPVAQLVYRVDSVRGGHFEALDAPGLVLQHFTQADVDQGFIRFVLDDSGVAPDHRLRLADASHQVALGAPLVSGTLPAPPAPPPPPPPPPPAPAPEPPAPEPPAPEPPAPEPPAPEPPAPQPPAPEPPAPEPPAPEPPAPEPPAPEPPAPQPPAPEPPAPEPPAPEPPAPQPPAPEPPAPEPPAPQPAPAPTAPAPGVPALTGPAPESPAADEGASGVVGRPAGAAMPAPGLVPDLPTTHRSWPILGADSPALVRIQGGAAAASPVAVALPTGGAMPAPVAADPLRFNGSDGPVAGPVLPPWLADWQGSRLGSLLDTLAQPQLEGLAAQQQVLAGGAAVSGALTVGYVLWLARGGLLMASVLSALPAWSSVDPLPVLQAAKAGRRRHGPAGDDTVEQLFDPAGAGARASMPPPVSGSPQAPTTAAVAKKPAPQAMGPGAPR